MHAWVVLFDLQSPLFCFFNKLSNSLLILFIEIFIITSDKGLDRQYSAFNIRLLIALELLIEMFDYFLSFGVDLSSSG